MDFYTAESESESLDSFFKHDRNRFTESVKSTMLIVTNLHGELMLTRLEGHFDRVRPIAKVDPWITLRDYFTSRQTIGVDTQVEMPKTFPNR